MIYRAYTFDGGRLVRFQLVTDLPREARKIGGMDVWGHKLTREKWIKYCLQENDTTFGTDVRTEDEFEEYKRTHSDMTACPKCGAGLIEVEEGEGKNKICPRCGWMPY